MVSLVDELTETLKVVRLNPTEKDLALKQRHPAFVITMINDHASVVGARRAIKSIQDTKSSLRPFIEPAVTPETLDDELAHFGLTVNDWTWPRKPGGIKHDIASGMELHAYGANDLLKVMACMVSHMKLWKYSCIVDQPIIILEHDAIFTRKFDIVDLPSQARNSIIQLNNPLGATRKASEFYKKVEAAQSDLPDNTYATVPWIDDKKIPQGIAGNSAYYIPPTIAKTLLKLIDEHGLWPNDALMCKQLLGDHLLKVAYPYFTTLQGIKSTTQG